ncbi:MAG: hypothetical protein OER86_08575 [Phycisphaerae bacterium]|nr:hypothetical protein [Phycisphaerae bacterium]
MLPAETSPQRTASMDAPPQRRSRWWWFGMVVFVLALLVLGAFAALRVGLSRGVKVRVAEISAAGHPTTPAEVENWHPYPVGANAADEYAKAFSLVSKPDAGLKATLPLLGDAKFPADPADPLTAVTAKAIASHVQANRGGLEGLHAAAKIGDARWPVDWTQGFSVKLGHLQYIRDAARLLAVEAAHHGEAGNAEAAQRSILSGMAVGRSLETEPSIISQLVRLAVVNITVDALERLLNRTDVAQEELGRLQAALADAEAPEAMRRAIVGERALGSSLFGDPGLVAAMGGSGAADEGMGLYRLVGLMDYDHLLYLGLMKQYVEGAGKPFVQRPAAYRDAEGSVKDVGAFGGVVTRMIVPGLGHAAVREGKTIARLRAAHVAMASERHRLEKGQWPSDTKKLIPEFLKKVPADPFTGKALGFKQTKGRLIVYSVGEDKIDGGGTGDDIVFRLSRPIQHEK